MKMTLRIGIVSLRKSAHPEKTDWQIGDDREIGN
jgi:hypothetical protein